MPLYVYCIRRGGRGREWYRALSDWGPVLWVDLEIAVPEIPSHFDFIFAKQNYGTGFVCADCCISNSKHGSEYNAMDLGCKFFGETKFLPYCIINCDVIVIFSLVNSAILSKKTVAGRLFLFKGWIRIRA